MLFLLGAGDGLTGVLLHTLPLAIAAALATFAITSGSLKLESLTSVIVLACIILLGTSVGGFLRQFVPDVRAMKPIAMKPVVEVHECVMKETREQQETPEHRRAA